MKAYRRTKKFVDPQVQGALAMRMAFHWAIYLVVTALLLVGMQWLCNPFMPFLDHVSEVWWNYGPILIVLVCLAPLFVYDAVKLSNRFSGPILRIRRATAELAEGKTPRKINLRKGDFWTELAADLNRVIDRVDPPSEDRG